MKAQLFKQTITIKMKKYLIMAALGIILWLGCSKENEIPKCTDTQSINYGMSEPCVYPSDKLVGNYAVKEIYVSKENNESGTYTYTAMVSKVDYTNIKITYSQSPKLVFSKLNIDWGGKSFYSGGEYIGPPISKIINDNSFWYMSSKYGIPYPLAYDTVLFTRK